MTPSSSMTDGNPQSRLPGSVLRVRCSLVVFLCVWSVAFIYGQCAYAGTFVSGDKAGVAAGYANYRDRRTYLIRSGSAARINFGLNERTHLFQPSQIYERHRRVVQDSIHFPVKPHFCHLDLLTSTNHCAIRRLHRMPVRINYKIGNNCGGFAVFNGGECQRNYRHAPNPISVSIRSRRLVVSKNCRNNRDNLHFGGSHDVLKCSTLRDRLFSNCVAIKVKMRSYVFPSDKVKNRPFFQNLALLRNSRLYSFVRVQDGTISSNKNVVAGNHHNPRRSQSRHGKNENSCQQPEFFTRNDNGTRIFSFNYPSLETGYEVVFGTDIDVSCDGRHWFHLLGPRCLKGRQPIPY
jgi:hypothetical protein